MRVTQKRGFEERSVGQGGSDAQDRHARFALGARDATGRRLCGGDDDDDDDAGSPPSGGGEFGSYASDLSTAIDNFVQTLPGLMNQQQFAAGNFDSLAEPYSDLADDLERARPPDALAEYHAALVEVIRATADAFEEGGIEALGRLDELASFPVPSDDVLEEFAREGGDIPACQNIGFADAS